MPDWNDAAVLCDKANVEIFYHDGIRYSEDDSWADGDGEPLPAGWYYWTCLPGCMPESNPFGPFETEEEAADDAVENFSLWEDGGEND